MRLKLRQVLSTLSMLALCLSFNFGASAESAAGDVVEETAPLAVTIDGRQERLEALVVHPAGKGRFPIALIVNGAFSDAKSSHPAGIAHIAHDFAHRGWLAAVVGWRGYGLSSGAIQSEAGTCTAPDPKRFLDAHAADLAAALTALRARPDADPAIAVGLGISIGGASMLDVASTDHRPLTAVINISGGLYHNSQPFAPDPTCGPFEADLIRTIGTFGTAHIPTLWIYAVNDPWFRPDLVRKMADAYRQHGGLIDFAMLPPFGIDGHKLYRWEANVLTQPLIDQFLRANHLPAMVSDEAFASQKAALGPDDRVTFNYYRSMPTEKALALPDGGPGAYISFAKRSIAEARQEAMLRCVSASRGPCHIVAQNRDILPGR